MSIYSNRLALQSDKVKAQGPSPDSLTQNGLLSNAEASVLSKSKLEDADVSVTLSALVKLLFNANQNDIKAWTLCQLADVITDSEDRAKQLAKESQAIPTLLKLSNDPDDFLRLKSLSVLTPALAAQPETAALNAAFASIARLLRPQEDEQDWDSQMIALQSAAALFKSSLARNLAWENEDKLGLVKAIVEVLSISVQQTRSSGSWANGSGTSTPQSSYSNGTPDSSASSPQLHYYLGLALWILTFESSVAESINVKYPKLVPLLAELARSAVKEKIVRVVLATFRNLVVAAPSVNLPPLFTARLLPFLKLLTSQKKWSDEEIKADVELLSEQLQETKKTLTTYDEYAQELQSGYLTWDTPTHQDEEFWRVNASRLLEKDKQGVKALVEALKSNDTTILAIACNDIAQFVKYCDSGRRVLSETPAKTRVMELMNHPDQSVRFKALLAVQRLVSHSWE